MKKYLFLIATAITLGFTSCSEEECDHIRTGGGEPQNSIVGSWYEEAENEEMRFGENGSFYDKYCNVTRSEETEGRWEYDSKNSKLTYTYSFMGQSQFADWTVKDLKELSFTISSTTVADHKLERIVETYQLEVGESVSILFESAYPSYTVQSYTSSNERLASVTSNGVITAEGEKGTAYIKISTNQGNVWVKVIVGVDCLDLWYDYVSVIGMSYDEMRAALSRLGEPYNEGQDYAFGFIHSMHNIVDIVKVYLAPSTGLVSEIQILLKDGVPEAEVLSYMNSHYYKFAEKGNYTYFSTLSDMELSKAIVAYNKAERTVLLFETQSFLNPPVADLWTDFVHLFGMDKNYVRAKMDEYEYPFLMSDDSYSANGSDYYSIMDNEYATMVGFVFNPDNVVSEYWVYMNTNSDANAAYNYLSKKYKENMTESTEKSLVFYNEDETLKVVFNLNDATTIYTNLALKQHETKKDLWADYTVGLGKTIEQLMEEYGDPFYNSGDHYYYMFNDKNLELCSFTFNKGAKKCTHVSLFHKKELASSDVIKYLGTIYTVYGKGVSDDGSQYKWINGASIEEATLGVTYYINDRMITYQTLR